MKTIVLLLFLSASTFAQASQLSELSGKVIANNTGASLTFLDNNSFLHSAVGAGNFQDNGDGTSTLTYFSPNKKTCIVNVAIAGTHVSIKSDTKDSLCDLGEFDIANAK